MVDGGCLELREDTQPPDLAATEKLGATCSHWVRPPGARRGRVAIISSYLELSGDRSGIIVAPPGPTTRDGKW